MNENVGKINMGMIFMICDISRIYFYAPTIRPAYMIIIDEDYEFDDEEKYGSLNVSIYDTRDVALNWHEQYKIHLRTNGFTQGKSIPCVSIYKASGIRPFIHGDDYVVNDTVNELKRLSQEMNSECKYKIQFLDPDKEDEI